MTTAAAMLLAACSSGSSDVSGSKITAEAVEMAAGTLGPAGGVCPLHLDVAAALRAAGITATAKPDSANGPSATGETPKTGSQGSPSKMYNASVIECSYVITVGGADSYLDVDLFADRVAKKPVLNLTVPLLRSHGGVSMADMEAFVNAGVPVGQTKVTGGDATAAYTHLASTDSSDVGVEIGVPGHPDSGKSPVSGAAMQKLAETLAGQIKL